ncbi:putative rhomboid protease ROM1 [Blattamonas nauphoetae]|uniref:rhomboid protease n=1 Tax=Blattamonas nauphoetae TaxID=2049346 RepID=A0ABQ9X5Y2_9EUKA|nr:putative rhomboid protease ROM1 [Blattamonas nauphoetae]
MPIHTLSDTGNDRNAQDDSTQPLNNPWRNQPSNTQPAPAQNRRDNYTWGAGQTVTGQTVRAERSRGNSSRRQNTEQAESQQPQARRGGVHTVSDYRDADQDRQQAIRQQGGGGSYVVLADPLWSNNLPAGSNPSFSQMCAYSCGCGCCIGPCCSAVRQKDWKHFWMMLTPWLTIVQIIMFIVSCCLGGVTGIVEPASSVLQMLGSKVPYLIKCKGQVFRLVSPCLLHGGLFHLIFNMFFQLRIMLQQEAVYGFWKTLFIYIVSTITGTLYSCLLYPTSNGVGASGALMGIYGYFMVDFFSRWKKYPTQAKVMQVTSMVMFIVIMVMLGFFTSGVDHGAHLGGALGGISLALILIPFAIRAETRQWKTKYKVTLAIGIVLFLVASVLPLVLFLTVTNKWVSC